MTTSPALSIGVVGSSKLSDAFAAVVARDHRVAALSSDPPGAGDVDAVLLVGDDADRRARERWNTHCVETGVPLLQVQIEPGAAIVGPWVRSPEPGCLACLDARRLRARNDIVEYATLRERSGAELDRMGSAWVTAFASEVLCALVAREIASAGEPSRGERRAFIRITLDGLRTSRHRFLPDPLCARCGRLPDDTRQAATLALESRR
jgi:ribosomal protein S12 methylthiotransferase accessory factor